MENLFSMEKTSELVSFIILIITFLGIVFAGIRKIYLFFKKYWGMVDSAFDKLDYVYKEVKPNHGSSIYDKITKISETQKLMNRELFVQTRVSRQIRDDMTDLMYCEFTEYGDFVFANKHFEEVTGLQSEEMQGAGWVKFICEKDRDMVYQKWKESLDNKTPFSTSFCLITKDGGEMPAHIKMQQIKDASGNIVYFVGRIQKK